MEQIKLTQEILKELLHYNPETGVFIWKERSFKMFSHCKNPERICNSWNTRYSGKVAGYKRKNEKIHYNIINISNGKVKLYAAHRLAFLYMTGKFPEDQVDHINGNGYDNKWNNLRSISNQENSKNVSISSLNTSGFTGVYWDKERKKWAVTISINNKTVSGGRFMNKEDAIIKRKQMNLEYGFHKNHGRKN